MIDQSQRKILIGTSGYSYSHWRDVFYPKDVPKNSWLEYYSYFFEIVELNVTFYNIPNKEIFTKWYDLVPPTFKFAVKGPRTVTHYKKLKNINGSLDIFYDRISALKDKLEVILWQFQPAWELDLERFSTFIEILRKFPAARYAFEFRNITWFEPEVYKLLASINATIVLCDWPFNIIGENQASVNDIKDKEKIIVPDMANFFYIRRHGASNLYSSLYDENQLKKDASSIEKWSKQGNDVYEFFNNDAEGNAIKNARELKSQLKIDEE